jgi:hypothetical protein
MPSSQGKAGQFVVTYACDVTLNVFRHATLATDLAMISMWPLTGGLGRDSVV